MLNLSFECESFFEFSDNVSRGSQCVRGDPRQLTLFLIKKKVGSNQAEELFDLNQF